MRSHYQLQLGTYFDTVQFAPDSVVAVGKVPSCIWNHSAVWPGVSVTGAWLDRAEADIRSKARPVSIYVEGPLDQPTESLLCRRNLQSVDTEVWMRWADPASADLPNRTKLMEARTSGLKSIFGGLMESCFDTDHRRAIESEKFLNGGYRAGNHYLAVLAGDAIGGVSVYSADGWVALHDVCVAPVYRGIGLGRDIVRAALVRHLPEATLGVFLQCDGGWMEQFYRSCGFVEFYRRFGFSISESECG